MPAARASTTFRTRGVCSWYDFAHAIAAEAGHTQCTIEPCHSSEYPSKVERPAYSVLDKSKIKATFGGEDTPLDGVAQSIYEKP